MIDKNKKDYPEAARIDQLGQSDKDATAFEAQLARDEQVTIYIRAIIESTAKYLGKKVLFSIGRTLAFTQGTDNLVNGDPEIADDRKQEILNLLMRHATGDWGDIDSHDLKVNIKQIKHGGRVLSSYIFGGKKIWIITDDVNGKYSYTTILLPEEY